MKKILKLTGIFLAILIFHLNCKSSGNTGYDENIPDTSLVYIGTYTLDNAGKPNGSKGIYIYSFNNKTGDLKYNSTSPQTENPSYLAIHATKKYLYCVNELDDSTGGGYLTAFKIGDKGKSLSYINSVPSEGAWPCHLSVDNSGKYIMDANYGSGTVALFGINTDGSLTTAKYVHQHVRKMTDGPEVMPHAHMIQQAKLSSGVFSTDLGTDMVWAYVLDTLKEKLEPAKIHIPTQSGAGPRHFEFHPFMPWVYVLNELNGTIEAFSTDSKIGFWNRFQVISTLGQGKADTISSADIHISPSGKFLYASNRAKINNIAMYQINQQSGELKFMGLQGTGGKTPRNFAISPGGRFMLVANQNSNNIVVFKIDPENGWLESTEKSVSVPAPVCIKFY